MELQALFYIIELLLDKNFSNDEKLELIHLRTLVLCYVCLFIVSFNIRLILILSSPYWVIVSGYLFLYVITSVARFDNKQEMFDQLVEKWDSEDRITLYEIKVKYFKNDKHRRTHGKSSKRP